MSGTLLVIEGLDGSGKATQAQLLYDSLLSEGKSAVKISFPVYESDSSALVRMYLSGAFGSEAGDVNAYAASCFYAVDRYASYKADPWGRFYDEGGLVIADRYTTSNAIHQCSKLPREEWDGYLDWLFDFEYRMIGIPAPARVLYLNVDPAVSQRLMTKRYEGHEEKKDIHEKDVAYLRRCREAADYCVSRLGWQRIECCRGGELRSVGEIQAEIRAALRRASEM